MSAMGHLIYTNASASCVVNVAVDSDSVITLMKDSTMGFDSERNLRSVPIGKNTVAELREQFENESLVFCGYDGTELAEADLVGTGAVIKLLDGDTLLDSTTVALTGDFNRDGLVDGKDESMVGQYVLERRTADEIQMLAADVNGDGKVNNRDRVMLLRYLVGKETL